jgi:glycine cleavage system H protein
VAQVNNCNLPEDLYYWPEKHIWVRPEDDGTITVGITDVAQSLAKTIAPEPWRAANGLGRSRHP